MREVPASPPSRQWVEQIYLEHVDAIWALCRGSGLSDDDAADIVQETFRAAVIARRRPVNTKAWLRGVAAKKLADHFKDKSKRREAIRRSIAEQTPSGWRSHGEARSPIVDPHESHTATELLSVLTHDQLVAVFLKYWADLESKEIARRLNVEPVTVRARQARAVKHMVEEAQRLARAVPAPNLHAAQANPLPEIDA